MKYSQFTSDKRYLISRFRNARCSMAEIAEVLSRLQGRGNGMNIGGQNSALALDQDCRTRWLNSSATPGPGTRRMRTP